MRLVLSPLKEWGPPALSLGLVLAAAGYAWSRNAAARDTIFRASALGASLSDMATTAGHAVLTPEEYAELEQAEADARARVDESGKSALIAAQLNEAAARTGARFIGSEPLAEQNGKGDGPRYPRQRVTLEGSFRQLADFLDGCPRQRLPLRVAEFVISRAEGGAPRPGAAEGNDPRGESQNLLRASITLESFAPAKPTETSTNAMS